MTAPDPLLIALGGFVLMAVAWLLAVVFRSGSHERFVTWRPFIRYAVFIFAVLLVRWVVNWLTDDPELTPIGYTLAAGGIAFGIASAVWFTGFLFGHWRRERRSGILSGRR